MSLNPFNSETFINVWNNHFNNGLSLFKFNFINDIAFIKKKFSPVYLNVGNSLTNGIIYKLQDLNENDFNGKTFLIKDIPSYQPIDVPKNDRLKQKNVFQYEGYFTNIRQYESLEEYLNAIYKSNTRSKLRRNMNRLEACFKVDYTMYFGDISKNTFKSIFEKFYKLLEKRYSSKGVPCGELQPEIWRYYEELAFKMINEKTASLFVVYCDQMPVGITFSYHFNDVLIEALTVFDIDLYRFNIGHTSILKMLEWSFNNKISKFDYTQGNFEYKRRWSDNTYKTYFHILYDSKSIKSIINANILEIYYSAKRVFREKKINEKIHRLKHVLFPKYKKKKIVVSPYKIERFPDKNVQLENFKRVNLYSDSFISQRKALFDYLYMNPEPVYSLEIFMSNNNLIYVRGKNDILNILPDVK